MSRFVHAHTPLLDLPAEVQNEVDTAWERAQDLLAGELELHFSVSFDGRVRGELRVPGGETVESVSATEALALACGDAELALAA